MIKPLILILLSAFILQSDYDERNNFLRWKIKSDKIKFVLKEKAEFKNENFRILPDSVNQMHLENFYKETICGWMKFNSEECNHLKQQAVDGSRIWNNKEIRGAKIVNSSNGLSDYAILSEPLFLHDLAILKEIHINKFGNSKSIIVYKKQKSGKWEEYKTIANITSCN